ncbi:hypothetical protein ASA1KI_24810 [Opitutales bacterium ASA1]|uniref:acyltransferase n=1 Tax=Congregicoccus parvus TaxID=3081749 RepID=UPI002B29B85C|nr:hypothetical protein ASA1KI_24810 [Opitutales bacterium ASA1]
MDTQGPMLEHDWFPRPLPPCASVGERSWIYSSFAFVHCAPLERGAVRIGADTGVYNGTFFDLAPGAHVEIGDFCTLVGAIVRTSGLVSIGDYTFIAHEVVFADDAHAAPPRADEPAPTREARPILLGPNCWIGMGAILLGGTELGEGCVVGAGAVVDFAAPPFSIVAGNPARIVGTAR